MGRLRPILPLAAAALLALAAAGAADAGRIVTSSAPAQWRTWWGDVAFGANTMMLSSAAPTSPAETHSALVTSKRTWRDQTISVTTTTLAQLRTGSEPNTWEVGWLMFRFRDLENYYYFILKTNGFELGKKQGSDAQVFLVTGDLPRLALGDPRRIQVQVQGGRIRAAVDGVQVLDFVDPNPLLGSGSVGLYEEDARVRFDSFTAG